jgi:hypothetical protein
VARSLVKAHPLLRSTVRLDNDTAAAFAATHNTNPQRLLLPLQDKELWPTLQIEYEKGDVAEDNAGVKNEAEFGWQYALRRELELLFVHNEALVRFLFYFPAEAADCAYLIIVAHHGLLDGRLLVILARDFVNGLRKYTVTATISAHQEAEEHVAPSMQRSSSLVDLIGKSFPKLDDNNEEDTCTSFPDANKTYQLDHSTELPEPSTAWYLYRKLSDVTVKKLASRCRKDGIRLTSAVIAALTGEGLARHLQRPEVKDAIGFQCCVDLRRYIEDDEDNECNAERTLGNLYSIADLKVPVPSNDASNNEDTEDLAASIVQRATAIQSELEEQLSDRRFLAGVHVAHVDDFASSADELCEKVETSSYHGRDFFQGVSNLDKLNLNEDASDSRGNSCIQESEYWFMSRLARVGSFCFLSFSYVPGYGVCFVFSRPDPVCSLESAQGIVDRTMDALETYAAG